MDLGAESVHGKMILFSRYLSHNKTERAKQFSVYMCAFIQFGNSMNVHLHCEVVTKAQITW